MRELGQVPFIFACEWFGNIEHMQNQLGSGNRLAAASNPFLFDEVTRLAQSCRVNKCHRQPADVGRFLNRVARRAGNR